ncbi:hypothetical protein ACRN98_20390, partial [Shewanella oncorhynchi]|uniref:hypothetical protein n=1 Tax=Shewanella oncorhynchi TaxID=2726434 RepID=UPI003D7B9B4E
LILRAEKCSVPRVMVHLKTWHVVSETKGQDQIRLIKNGSKKSLGANRGICVEETAIVRALCFLQRINR